MVLILYQNEYQMVLLPSFGACHVPLPYPIQGGVEGVAKGRVLTKAGPYTPLELAQ